MFRFVPNASGISRPVGMVGGGKLRLVASGARVAAAISCPSGTGGDCVLKHPLAKSPCAGSEKSWETFRLSNRLVVCDPVTVPEGGCCSTDLDDVTAGSLTGPISRLSWSLNLGRFRLYELTVSISCSMRLATSSRNLVRIVPSDSG